MAETAIAVVERNRAAGVRIARALSAAAGFAEVVVLTSPEQLADLAPFSSGLVGCDLADAVAVLDRVGRGGIQVLAWSTDSDASVRELRRNPALRNVVGWPTFLSVPRVWELGVVAHRLITGSTSQGWIGALAAPGGRLTYRPTHTEGRDDAVSQMVAALHRAGVPERSAARAGEVAHELLTNAMYAAPVDAWGRSAYALQRSAPIALDGEEVPTLNVAFDGQVLILEVIDHFGRLTEDQVLASLGRAMDNRSAVDEPVLDITNGGAGLGLGMVLASAIGLWVDVVPGRTTRVAWVHDVDVHPKDYRFLSRSVHLFRSHRGEAR